MPYKNSPTFVAGTGIKCGEEGFYFYTYRYALQKVHLLLYVMPSEPQWGMYSMVQMGEISVMPRQKSCTHKEDMRLCLRANHGPPTMSKDTPLRNENCLENYDNNQLSSLLVADVTSYYSYPLPHPFPTLLQSDGMESSCSMANVKFPKAACCFSGLWPRAGHSSPWL